MFFSISILIILNMPSIITNLDILTIGSNLNNLIDVEENQNYNLDCKYYYH